MRLQGIPSYITTKDSLPLRSMNITIWMNHTGITYKKRKPRFSSTQQKEAHILIPILHFTITIKTMKPREHKIIYTLLLLTIITAFITSCSKQNTSTHISSAEDEALDIIRNYYLYQDRIPDDLSSSESIEEMLKAIDDDYAAFYTREELNASVDEMNGDYVGIGFEALKTEGKYLVIDNVLYNGPAYNEGLLPGDMIIEIDGMDTLPMNRHQTLSLIRGIEGTEITLLVDRDGTRFRTTITRSKIDDSPITYGMLDETTGYIFLYSIPMGISEEFQNSLEDLLSRGMDNLILDLRYNTGGEIEEGTAILSMLLPESINNLFSIDYQNLDDRTLVRNHDEIFTEDILILVNNHTASVAEMIAGTLVEYNRASISGDRTYGKSTVQRFFYLESGDILKLTVGRMLLPSGKPIPKEGLSPETNEIPDISNLQ